MKSFKLIAVSLLALAASALASPKQLSLPVGHTTTLSMPAIVSKIQVDDPSLVDVRMDGRKVVIVALAKGSTDATVTTMDGEQRFHIYVAADKYALPY